MAEDVVNTNPGTGDHWAVVGGGMLGLTLALRLRQQGKHVTVLEGAPQVGGLAGAWQLGDITWDKHYHVSLLSDSALRGVLRELGLEREFRWVNTRTGFYADGRLYPLSSSFDYLRLPILGIIDKFRLAATILYASKLNNWAALEKIPVTRWLQKHSGRRTMQKVWLPLLRAKLGENYIHASAAFIWSVIRRLYAARRTGLKKEMFGYIPGGYAKILAVFAARLQELGVEIKTDYRVGSITADGDGSLLAAAPGQPVLRFDQVIVTAPCPVIPKICP